MYPKHDLAAPEWCEKPGERGAVTGETVIYQMFIQN
jgi:hypothetical protein